ncbi:NADP-dependent oxidoreductase domain-containing protein [Mycena alexandri]|uniref:NADP-dependent oxidoreductase domain-containing protein n=1 Tax=Mycena alexandri TaxID=1745969 RepID=A0AAD6S3X0_9AGAR|nr:NADP-dependent oxidoreductase domain-containing protein [Mycena alexandri]
MGSSRLLANPMPTSMRVVNLPNSGTSCPIIGIGAGPGMPIPPSGYIVQGDERREGIKNWLQSALDVGYRHIDTAYAYGTEKAVGETLRDSGINREEVFVVSKLPRHHHHRVLESIQETLDNLRLNWLNMYLMHWPFAEAEDKHGNPEIVESPTFVETWQGMEQALRQSKCKAIGVSNFSIKNLEILMNATQIKPAVNQVEMHPYLAENELLDFCKKHDIAVVAYTPTGKDTVRNDPVIIDIAKKHNKTSAQIILAWHLARNVVVIPKSSKAQHQKENLDLPTLDEEDIQRINSLDRGERVCNTLDANGCVYGMSREQLGW